MLYVIYLRPATAMAMTKDNKSSFIILFGPSVLHSRLEITISNILHRINLVFTSEDNRNRSKLILKPPKILENFTNDSQYDFPKMRDGFKQSLFLLQGVFLTAPPQFQYQKENCQSANHSCSFSKSCY